MGGDQLAELLQTNFWRSESPTGLGFSSSITSDTDFIDSLSSWCGQGFGLFGSDKLVYLEPRAYPTSSSSSPSSQLSMDDDWSPGFLNNSMNLQETILSANSTTRKVSDTHQEQLCPHFTRNDQQYSVSQLDYQLGDPNDSCLWSISEASVAEHQSRLPASTKQQTTLNSSKTTSAKRKTPAMKKSEHGIKKKPRTETDSSPKHNNNSKVGKEKMGNRITTLQRLVSPFGKADTASVLSECIEYIRFLHEQVSVLSTSYLLKNRADMQHFQDLDDCFYEECVSGSGSETGLRSRGLCIVPISTTFSLTGDAPVDFWTPRSGGSDHDLQN